MSGRLALTLFLATVVAVAGICVLVSCEPQSGDFASKEEYERLLSRPLKGLMDKGNSYYDADRLDSAYLMYAAVASRYTPSMSDEDKKMCERACNNAAYISHIYYNDYPQACALLLKGLEIADEVDFKDAYPFIYLNLGNLMRASGNWDAGMDYQVKAMESAVQVGDTVNYLKGATNLFSEAVLENRVGDFRTQVDEFPKLRSSGPLWTYTEKLHRVAEAQLAGNHAEVERILDTMAEEDDSGFASRERLVFFRNLILARTEELQGNPRKSVDILKGVEPGVANQPELKSYLYDALVSDYRALGMADSAAEYRLRYAELTDTLRSDKKVNSIYDMKRTYENRAINFRLEGLMRDRQTLVRTIWIVSGFTALVLVLLVIVIISRRKTLRAKREIYARNQELLREMDAHRAVPVKSVAATQPAESEQRPEPADPSEAEAVDEETLRRIKEVMETSPEIYTPDFSVERLAAILGLPVRKVSKTINDGLGQNFSTTLQTYRIREACRRLTDTEAYGHLTIEAISEGLGFKSRSNFNTVFKKLTGLTPAAWQKIAREK